MTAAFTVELYMIIQMLVFLFVDTNSWVIYQNQEVAEPYKSIINEPEAYLPWLIGEQKLVSISNYVSFLGLAFGYNLGAIAWFKLSVVYKEISHSSIEHKLEDLKLEPWISKLLKIQIDKALNSLIFERIVFVFIISLLALIAALIVLFEAMYPMMQVSNITMNTVILCMFSFVPVAFLLAKYLLKTRTSDCHNLINWYRSTYHRSS
ncbi:hypothetical protein [Colwellia sp. Arc7-D]|uniref:hypothetical protein n=1 Tax=Colwellia sp. Arc7-D TaxID=2161872 RepID=UPI0013A535A4|nr:hypothetical protein [Colwellia sp. Arc7-D]